MPTMTSSRVIADQAKFDAYCSRHAVNPDAALAELVIMALTLPADILDYLREQTAAAA